MSKRRGIAKVVSENADGTGQLLFSIVTFRRFSFSHHWDEPHRYLAELLGPDGRFHVYLGQDVTDIVFGVQEG